MNKSAPAKIVRSAVPLTGQRAHEIQAYGSVVPMPIALDEDTRRASVTNLNPCGSEHDSPLRRGGGPRRGGP